MARECGTCTLCCKLLPVRELDKLAGARCAHQRTHKGCAIYHSKPFSCAVWSCAWLADDRAGELRRPDRSRYVVDIMPDYITATYNDNSAPPRHVPVLQIWIDPKYPDAHRDPALRAYIQRRSDEAGGMAAIVRYDSAKAFVLFPPTMASDGLWHEEHSGQIVETHSAADVLAVLSGV